MASRKSRVPDLLLQEEADSDELDVPKQAEVKFDSSFGSNQHMFLEAAGNGAKVAATTLSDIGTTSESAAFMATANMQTLQMAEGSIYSEE